MSNEMHVLVSYLVLVLVLFYGALALLPVALLKTAC
jgi:hypothetical protein